MVFTFYKKCKNRSVNIGIWRLLVLSSCNKKRFFYLFFIFLTCHGTTGHGTTGHGTTGHGTTGHGTTCHGTTCHGTTCHGTTGHSTYLLLNCHF